MACVDHECDKCGAWWSDNLISSDCPTEGCTGTASNWHDEDDFRQGGGGRDEEEEED